MNRFGKVWLAALAGATLALVAGLAMAQEATIRKALAERLPNLPKIDEVRATPIPGIYELRVNESDIYYTDAQGNYVIQGNLIDTKTRRNLTEERLDKLSAIAFDNLPLKDAFVIKRGDGSRKLAMFEDPNCGYCKRFERQIAKLDNVTMYVFLYPILGPDSATKSQQIWCAPDKAKAFLDWMVQDQPLSAQASCDVKALERNVQLGRKHRITGTPTLVFSDGTRVPGAIGLDQVETQLAQAQQAKR